MDRLKALVFLRIKLEIRALSRARETMLGILLLIPGLLIATAFGSALAYFGLRQLSGVRPELAVPVISAAATLVGFFWSLAPLLTGVALVETHDVSRLLHFPIPPRSLVLSSLIANLAQPAVPAALVVCVAAGLGVARHLAFAPLALLGILLSFGFVLAAAQAFGLALHGLARRRQMHDAVLFAGVGLGFTMSLLPMLLLTAGGHVVPRALRFIVAYDIFALSPFSWGARAAVLGGRGQVAPFVLWSLLEVLAIGATVMVSIALMQRIHRGEVVTTVAGGRGRRSRALLPGSLGALIEKDLRTGWRDPAIRATVFMGLIAPLAILAGLSQTRMGHSTISIPFLAVFMGLSPFGSNAFGLERRGLALLMSFPMARWRILVAKNLASILLRLPGLFAVFSMGLVLAPLEVLPGAAVAVVVTLLLAVGADNFLSTLFPVPAPPVGGNPYAAHSGSRGMAAALIAAAMLTGVTVVALPFVFLAWLPTLVGRLELAFIALPLALVGAGAVYAMLVLGAERLLVSREPELLERVLGEG